MVQLEEIYQLIIKDKQNKKMIEKGYKPIYKVSPKNKILIIGQAPGIKTQLKGDVFRDRSGENLMKWLGIDQKTFYCSNLIGVLPMDFFYPGKGVSGDLPPRKDFSDKWHPIILNELKSVELIILLGDYANKYYLKDQYKKNLTETVKNYKNYLPKYFPLIHPSPRNNIWISKNPWFENVLKELKKQVKTVLLR